MLSVENVATPFTAATVAVPDRVPPAGLVPIATVTLPVNPRATFPTPSSAVTRTAGVIVAPAVVLLGWTVNTRCVAVTVVTLNNGLFTATRPVDVARSRYPFPALLIDRSGNVATPATATTGLVPERVPPPGFAVAGIAKLTLPVNCVAVLPNASRAVTSTGGVMIAPCGVVPGGTVNASTVAAPGVMSNVALVAPVGPVAPAVSV